MHLQVGYPTLLGPTATFQHGKSMWATNVGAGFGLFAAVAHARFGPMANLGGSERITVLFHPTIDAGPALVLDEFTVNGGASGTVGVVFWGKERRKGFDLRATGGGWMTSYQGGVYPQVQLALGAAFGKKLKISMEE